MLYGKVWLFAYSYIKMDRKIIHLIMIQLLKFKQIVA